MSEFNDDNGDREPPAEEQDERIGRLPEPGTEGEDDSGDDEYDDDPSS